jgi:CMP-N-acetylneuraminic acid synthetase
MQVIALISARGISGELRRKNVHPVLGRPMIDHTFDAIRDSGIVDRTYVFTEDPEIAALTERAGGTVIPRTKDQVFYNGGFSPAADWGRHVTDFIERDAGPRESRVDMALNCNFCLLTGGTLARMYYTLMEHEFATEIVGVTPVEPHLFMVNPATGTLFPVWHEPGLDRQKYPPLVRLVGGVALYHRKREAESHMPKRLHHTLTAWEALDVQSAEDVEMAEYVLHRRQQQRRAALGVVQSTVLSPLSASL